MHPQKKPSNNQVSDFCSCSLCFRLAKTFANAVPDVKRSILKNLDVPLKSLDMESPQLFKLLETCPDGTETFITKALHVVTERGNVL
jgi:hypothetical protein